MAWAATAMAHLVSRAELAAMGLAEAPVAWAVTAMAPVRVDLAAMEQAEARVAWAMTAMALARVALEVTAMDLLATNLAVEVRLIPRILAQNMLAD